MKLQKYFEKCFNGTVTPVGPVGVTASILFQNKYIVHFCRCKKHVIKSTVPTVISHSLIINIVVNMQAQVNGQTA